MTSVSPPPVFQPTLPARGATVTAAALTADASGFQPTLPARGATACRVCWTKICGFQPTLPARGATQQLRDAVKSAEISTHAPRTGSDGPPDAGKGRNGHISTHAPRTGSDRRYQAHHQAPQRFQPTLPARGATTITNFQKSLDVFQPTLPARGATERMRALLRSGVQFQPTLPARGATRSTKQSKKQQRISTHAPRTGSDLCNQIVAVLVGISTHAPRTGSDLPGATVRRLPKNFNPRSPHGERRRDAWQDGGGSRISTHAPRTGSDPPRTRRRWERCYFNPRSPHGERPASAAAVHAGDGNFNPRSPHGERHIDSLVWVGDTSFQPTLPARGATIGTQ